MTYIASVKNYLILFIAVLFLYACKKEQKFEGLWVGASYELDTDFYTPLVNFINAKADSSLEIGFVGQNDFRPLKWHLDKGKLYLDTNRFLKSQYEVVDQILTFKNPYQSKYFRAEKVTLGRKIDDNFFHGKTFKGGDNILQFSNDSTLIFSNGSTTEQACFSVWEKEGCYFLVKKGSTFSCDRNYRFTEQIIGISDQHFEVKRWQNGMVKTVQYKMVSSPNPLKLDNFQLCNSYLYRNNPRHRYYYKGVFYKGGNYKIEKLFHKHFKAEDYADISGLLQLEFIVNCKGQAGRFSLKQFNLDFELAEFPLALQDKIMAFGKSLQEWNAGKNDHGVIIDTYRFLNFKFKDGELVEIFP